MTTITQNVKTLQFTENSNPMTDIKPTNALATNVKFLNGKTTNVITLFNSADLNFEEVNMGVDIAIKRHEWLKIIETQSVLYRFDKGHLKKTIEWEKEELFKKVQNIETNTENTETLQFTENSNPIADIKPTHALVTNVWFSTGKTSNIVTLFNCQDLSFEEINIGVNTMLKRQHWLGIINKKTVLYRFENEVLKKVIQFREC